MPVQPWKEALLVGVGAGLGAAARFLLTAAAPASGFAAEFASILIINIAGSFALGLFKPGPLLGVGFLGGFTTFSAMAVAAVQSSALGAAVISVLSLLGCVSGWLAGDFFSQKRGQSQ